jgi:hypothetical protein
MKLAIVLFVFLATSFTFAGRSEFPKGPEATLTPGSLCDRPTEYRYPERIAYCKRDVSSEQKQNIFQDYRNIGYNLDPRSRSSYKIDHYIPLCAGGSNHDDNLWPQHLSVYNITDPLEALGCEKLKEGKITQKDLIALIKKVKNDLAQINFAMGHLNSL